jgi:hypothetical protein
LSQRRASASRRSLSEVLNAPNNGTADTASSVEETDTALLNCHVPLVGVPVFRTVFGQG